MPYVGPCRQETFNHSTLRLSAAVRQVTRLLLDQSLLLSHHPPTTPPHQAVPLLEPQRRLESGGVP